MPTFKDYQLDLYGYEPGAPGEEAAEIDKAVAEDERCQKCGGVMTYRPFCKYVNGRRISYRAFAVCVECDEAIEF